MIGRNSFQLMRSSFTIWLACVVSSTSATLFTIQGVPILGTEEIRLSPGSDLSELDLANLDVPSNTNLIDASFANTNLEFSRLNRAKLSGADFTGAVVRGAALGELTQSQIYSTESYRNKDLYGIQFSPKQLPAGEQWNFSGQDLHAATLVGDFSNADFSNADVRNAQLSGDYTGVNWTNTQLKSVNPSGNFANTDWSNRDLSNALLGARFPDSDFSSSNLTNAEFRQGAYYANANFSDATIDKATLYSPGLSAEQFYSTANYQAGDLQDIRFLPAGLLGTTPYDLDGWDFSNKVFSDSWIFRGTAQDADFRSASLQRTYLNGTNFAGTDFGGADLTYASLNYAKLDNTNFEGSNLSYAALKDADLSSANFANANLVGVDLDRASIDANTIMTGAKLQYARLSSLELNAAMFDSSTQYNQWTVFPEGFDPIRAGLSFREAKAGDLNANGVLDGNDITLMATRLRPRPPANLNRGYAKSFIAPFDLTSDDEVDKADLQALLELANAVPGDTDLNGSVGFDDFLVLSKNFGQAGGWEDGDFDGNGSVAFRDFAALSVAFGQQTPSRIAAVPEPSTKFLVTFGLLVLLQLTRRSPSS